MKTAVINIKTQPELKRQASRLASLLGLSLSQVIHISLQNFITAGSITASAPEPMTKQLEKKLKLVEKELQTRTPKTSKFSSPTDMDAYLAKL